MSTTFEALLLYTGGLLILFLVPGPVWVALMARSLSGGFSAAWPLALGVAIGDAFWPLVTILGLASLIALYPEVLSAIRYAGSVVFLWMGVGLLRKSGRLGRADEGLMRHGKWASFTAGILAILGNPKAILFYIGLLPGFFDIAALTPLDIVLICLISLGVPLLGNLSLGLMIHRLRGFLSSPEAVRRINIGSGVALICVACFIALS